MSLKEKILSDIKDAMKAKDSKKLEVLRFVNAQIKNKEIELRPNTITDEDTVQVFKKFVKQRNEAAEQFKQAGREDLVEKENFEAAVIESYLPKMMSEDQLKPIVENIIKETGASSVKDMGNVMKEVLAQTKGLADGKMVSTLVKNALS